MPDLTLPQLDDVLTRVANRQMSTEGYQKREWIDISGLNKISCCPRKEFYRHGLGLTAPGIRLAMDYGTGIHKALPELLITSDKHRALSNATKAFMSVWTTEHEAMGDDRRNLNRFLASIDNFFDLHAGRNSMYELVEPPQSELVRKKESTNDYEIPFGIDIGLPIPLVGRVDALVRHRDTRDLWALEWKTTGQGGNWFLGNFDLSPQCIGYTHALRSMGIPVKGTILEYVLSAKTKVEVMAKPIFITDHMCEMFVGWAQRFGRVLLASEADGYWEQWLSGCTPYAQHGQPGFACEFTKLCSVPDWQSLRDLYSVKRWNPFEVTGEI